MNKIEIKEIIEENLDDLLECPDAIEAMGRTSADRNEPYWNYLLIVPTLPSGRAIGSIDFVPSKQKIFVNLYDTVLTLSDSYRTQLQEELQRAIDK